MKQKLDIEINSKFQWDSTNSKIFDETIFIGVFSKNSESAHKKLNFYFFAKLCLFYENFITN